MGTYNTTFCLVNLSGRSISSTSVAIDDPDDWDYVTDENKNRPDLNLGGGLDSNNARCEREEINAGTSKGCWFTVGLDFIGLPEPLPKMEFKVNQWDAVDSGHPKGTISFTGGSTDWEVYKVAGKDYDIYTQAVYIRPSVAPDNSGWMGKLLGYNSMITLNKLTMPGSHDAGMYLGTNEWSKTQHLSIGDQLKAGSRYFDIRVCLNDNELWTYHGIPGSMTYGGKLSDILDDVKTFLDTNTQEAVFLKFRSYGDSADQSATVSMVETKLDSHLYKSTTTPVFANMELGSLAGKAVAVFHKKYGNLPSPSNGTFAYRDYGNEDSGAFTPPANENCFGVYDSYTNTTGFPDMLSDQMDKFRRFAANDKNYLFLLSWTLTGYIPDQIMDLTLLSNAANPQMPKALKDLPNVRPKVHPNIVYIDNVDPWLCTPIINLNYG